MTAYTTKTTLRFILSDLTQWEIDDITDTTLTIYGRNVFGPASGPLYMTRKGGAFWALDEASLWKLRYCFNGNEWPAANATPTAFLLERFINANPPTPEMLAG